MSALAYYNENDEDKAAWLRELIREGVIASGEVDTRSIAEVWPEDLAGFTQCHFFAGIGVWSYALRLAGWPDDRPVWTGSCPCQSFSAAGKGKGFADPRHLWPYWSSLISKCKPATVFGEQVASAIGHGWLDLVYVDLEAAAYSVGAAVLGACSVGAPHIRQRLYFCAHAVSQCVRAGNEREARRASATNEGKAQEWQWIRDDTELFSATGVSTHTEHAERWTERQEHADAYGRDGLGRSGNIGSGSDSANSRRQTAGQHGSGQPSLSARPEQCGDAGERSNSDGGESSDGDVQRSGEQRLLAEDCGTSVSADAEELRLEKCGERNSESQREREALARRNDAGGRSENVIGSDFAQRGQSVCGSASEIARHAALAGQSSELGNPSGHGSASGISESGPRQERLSEITEHANHRGATRGFWADCDWWYGRDGKYRPIEPGIFPLAHGASNRVLKLRGYGNAICAEVAKAFIEASEIH